jgi:hypothetical protein
MISWGFKLKSVTTALTSRLANVVRSVPVRYPAYKRLVVATTRMRGYPA